ncbi:MAG: methyl-accepting chemotaxis protein [Rhodanobacter sp.]|nr:MAG: methyl-accepting chemotaxis protein [Rhodanobacter sp.]
MVLSKFSIKARLLITLGVTSVMLIAVSLLGIRDLRYSNQSLHDIYINKLVPSNALAMAFELLGGERAAALRAAHAGSPEKADAAIAVVHDEQAELTPLLATFRSAKLSERERALVKRFEADRNAMDVAMGEVLQALAARNFKRAVKLLDGDVEDHYAAARQDVILIFKLEKDLAREIYTHDEQQVRRNALVAYVAMGAGVTLSLLFGFLLIRSITRSLRTALRVADNIAEGRLGNTVEIESRDELGRLLESLRNMDCKLTGIVYGVRSSSASVGAAAKQIAQGNNDLSERTQEQASSLEETAASMEEMTATVKQNAGNVARASQLAHESRDQATRGGEVAAQAARAMDEINSSSRKIADIVGLIDEIAFQTNLLALNAAVEAARAGEQGRGFAVVAGEVRNLAQRAAGAAREVKGLIGDSMEKVVAGTDLVSQSGHALEGIVESVAEVTDIVAEIAAASREQSSGIDQVNTAVIQMDEVTQKNAALVEEAAAASHAMQEQAQLLLRHVAFFHIGDEPDQGVEHIPVTPGDATQKRVAMPSPAPPRALGKPQRQRTAENVALEGMEQVAAVELAVI